MEDYGQQLELRRETIFKDAILSQAEAKGMEIIAEAGKKRAQELDAAHLRCEEANHDVIASQYNFEVEHKLSSATGKARQELLEYRTSLVNDLFAEVEKKIIDFTRADEYVAWLVSRLKKHTDLQSPVAYLRSADLPLAEKLKELLSSMTVEADDSISLGGLKISDGHRLFDETLDMALEEEKRAFYESGKMML